MKKKHLYGAMLWAFLVTANLCTGCSDDNDYPDVDGQNPTMTLATDHIESGAGHRFTIEGALSIWRCFPCAEIIPEVRNPMIRME